MAAGVDCLRGAGLNIITTVHPKMLRLVLKIMAEQD
jgi:hypothetical protein